ncbi:RhoGAP [Acrasis kona]|uniref:RhoGAP n=1 Tax=Acrasis kona TaxID=1008807 RepID=A0AAW2ZJB3_9EUKA
MVVLNHSAMKFLFGGSTTQTNQTSPQIHKPIFGASLEDLGEGEVPHILTVGLEMLQEHMKVEGLFRLSGDNRLMNQTRDDFNEGKYPTEEATREILSSLKEHTIAGLVKMWFRELSDPVLTFDHYDMFIAAHGVPDPVTRLDVIKKVLTFLPTQNKEVLRILCKFLNQLSSYQSENKMNSQNLSIVFAPNLLRPEGNQLKLLMSDSQYSTGLMKTLIDDYQFLI